RQRADIETLKEQASVVRTRLARDSHEVEERVDHLEREVGELALLCRALIAVLESQGGLQPEKLQEAMRSIAGQDALDAQESAKKQPKPVSRRPRPPRRLG